jgi:hypothetical protein
MRQVHADVVIVRICCMGGFGHGEGFAQLHQPRVAADHEVGGGLVGLGHVLRDLRQPPLLRAREITAVLVQRAVEEREQGGLAGAVAPHQPDLLAGVDGDAGAVEQHFGAAAQNDVFESDH